MIGYLWKNHCVLWKSSYLSLRYGDLLYSIFTTSNEEKSLIPNLFLPDYGRTFYFQVFIDILLPVFTSNWCNGNIAYEFINCQLNSEFLSYKYYRCPSKVAQYGLEKLFCFLVRIRTIKSIIKLINFLLRTFHLS
jgi:hypothetical protein